MALKMVVTYRLTGAYIKQKKLLTMAKVAEIVSEKTIQRIKTKKSTKKSSKKSTKKSSKKSKQKRFENTGSIEMETSETTEKTEITSSISDVEKEYKLRWIGGRTHVVQVGDQIDRCRPNGSKTCDNPLTLRSSEDEDSDTKILKLFTDLHEQAVQEGGAVISLLGNHELDDIISYINVTDVYNNTIPETNTTHFVPIAEQCYTLSQQLKLVKKLNNDLDANINFFNKFRFVSINY